MHKIPVGVLGASGYAGRELCALINTHPHFSLAFATANAQRGERAWLGGREVRFIASDDAPFSALALQNTGARSTITVPDSANVGVALKLDDALTVVADVTWTGWNKFNELRVYLTAL